jgi:hypothetical protein
MSDQCSLVNTACSHGTAPSLRLPVPTLRDGRTVVQQQRSAAPRDRQHQVVPGEGNKKHCGRQRYQKEAAVCHQLSPLKKRIRETVTPVHSDQRRGSDHRTDSHRADRTSQLSSSTTGSGKENNNRTSGDFSGNVGQLDKCDSGIFSDKTSSVKDGEISDSEAVTPHTSSSIALSANKCSEIRSPRPGDIPCVASDNDCTARNPSALDESVGSLSLHPSSSVTLTTSMMAARRGSVNTLHGSATGGASPAPISARRHPSTSSLNRDTSRHLARRSALVPPSWQINGADLPRDTLHVGNSPTAPRLGATDRCTAKLTTSPRRYPPFSPCIGVSPSHPSPRRFEVPALYYGTSCGFAAARAYAGLQQQQHHQRHPSLLSPSLLVAPCPVIAGGYTASPANIHQSYQFVYRM